MIRPPWLNTTETEKSSIFIEPLKFSPFHHPIGEMLVRWKLGFEAIHGGLPLSWWVSSESSLVICEHWIGGCTGKYPHKLSCNSASVAFIWVWLDYVLNWIRTKFVSIWTTPMIKKRSFQMVRTLKTRNSIQNLWHHRCQAKYWRKNIHVITRCFFSFTVFTECVFSPLTVYWMSDCMNV
jgi:hypothetical protein